MAVGTEITPVDYLSGLPLPIITTYKKRGTEDLGEETLHHLIHPGSHELLQTVGGLALRNCRLQRVPAALHNYGANSYHEYYAGPRLPASENDQFAMIVLACAGYMPKYGLDLRTRSGPEVVRMNKQQMKDLSSISNGDYYNFIFRDEPIRDFLRSYTLSQNLTHIDQSDIQEFLSTANYQRRAELGKQIIDAAIDEAVDGFQPKYQKAHQKGLLYPEAPPDSREIVKSLVVPSWHKSRIYKKLTSVLIEKPSFGVV